MFRFLKVIIIMISILLSIVITLYCENNLLSIKRFNITLERLPDEFDRYKIVHLSDLHDKEFGKNNWILTAIIKAVKPDLIVITGDLINTDSNDYGSILRFLKDIREAAPVYYVTGNHEVANKKFKYFEQELAKERIYLLRNSAHIIRKKSAKIYLLGIDDPITTSMHEKQFIMDYTEDNLKKALQNTDASAFKILLAHRPELFSIYADEKIDLIYAGHAHGGQIRLPFIGGLLAPGQGFLPKYTGGKYMKDSSVMILSRGLGNGTIPQRILNRPQIVITTLRKG